MAANFPVGGGRDDDRARASHAPFVAACDEGPILAFALEDPERSAARAIVGGSRLGARVARRHGGVMVSVQP